MILNSYDNKVIIFLQDICPFEAVGCARFLELVQHTVESRHYTMFIYYFLCYLIKQYACITVYLCFVFIIIGLSFLKISRPWAYLSLAHGYGLGLKRAGRAVPGPNINGLSQAWAGT